MSLAVLLAFAVTRSSEDRINFLGSKSIVCAFVSAKRSRIGTWWFSKLLGGPWRLLLRKNARPGTCCKSNRGGARKPIQMVI